MTAGRNHPARLLRGLGSAVLLLLLLAEPASAAEGLVDVPKLVNFTILATILVFALRKPISGYLKARTEQIRLENQKVKDWNEEAASLLAQALERKSSLSGEEEAAISRIREAAVEEAGRIVAEAEAQAEQILEQSQRELESRVRAAEGTLRRASARAAAEVARDRIRQEMNDADRHRLLDIGMDAIRAD